MEQQKRERNDQRPSAAVRASAQSAICNLQSAMQVVALVGGIGSGKSAVAEEFARRGAVVINGDALGHEVLREREVRDEVVSAFGRGVLDDDGEIDRRKLAAIVFPDPERRKQLERIVHPRIRARMEERVEQARRDGAELVVLDAAVLLEAGWGAVADRLIFVDAPEELRKQRVRERGWSEEEWRRRESAQMPLTRKRDNADHVVDNSSTRENLARQVEDLMRLWSRPL